MRSLTSPPEPVLPHIHKSPFEPHALLRNSHLMTFVGGLPRLGFQSFERRAEDLLLPMQDGSRLLLRCNWQRADSGSLRPSSQAGDNQPARHAGSRAPVMLLVHGLTGDARAGYMLATAAKAFEAGFSTLRLNLRNCGGTEALSKSVYHSGLWGDLIETLAALANAGHGPVTVVGFSLGGNLTLRMLGELGPDVPDNLSGVVAVSPPIDLSASADALDRSKSNSLYRRLFLSGLAQMVRERHRLNPSEVDLQGLAELRNLRDFDDRFTAPLSGHGNATRYYETCSALKSLGEISVPTLVIQARDDLLVPFQSFQGSVWNDNPNLTLLAPEAGGHLAFIGGRPEGGKGPHLRDRRWAEHRAVEFACMLEALHGRPPERPSLKAAETLD